MKILKGIFKFILGLLVLAVTWMLYAKIKQNHSLVSEEWFLH